MSTNEIKSPKPQDSINEIAKGIFQIKIPLLEEGNKFLDDLNAYLVAGTSGWFMIDAGWYHPFSYEALEKAFKTIDVKFKDVKSIILTHSHPDHYGMVGKIKQLSPDVKLFCHRWESDLIEFRYVNFIEIKEDIAFLLEKHGVPENDIPSLGSASMPMLERVMISKPDHMLYGGEVIHTGIFDLEVIWTPGHSPGHVCYYEPHNGFLFCGDHILPSISPGIGYHVFSGDNPLGDYLNSLKKLVHLDIAQAHPGHENSFKDVKNRINILIDHHRQRGKEIQELIKNNYSNSYQIASQLTWSLKLPWSKFPPLQKRFAITETIAHLEFMRWEGLLLKTLKNNQVRYDPVSK